MGIKKTAVENALALSKRRVGGLRPNETSGVSRLKKLGLSQGVAQRMVAEGEDVNVSALEVLAAGLQLQPWQLLVPNLNPDALPQLDASPFTSDVIERLRTASSVERMRAEAAVRAALDMPPAATSEGFQRTTLSQNGAEKSSPGARDVPSDRRSNTDRRTGTA